LSFASIILLEILLTILLWIASIAIILRSAQKLNAGIKVLKSLLLRILGIHVLGIPAKLAIYKNLHLGLLLKVLGIWGLIVRQVSLKLSCVFVLLGWGMHAGQ